MKSILIMKRIILAVIFLAATITPTFSAPDEMKPKNPDLMVGKQKTDRTIFLEAVIAAPPAEVFGLWTSAEGIKKFFAPDARVDATVGGRYEILFAPKKDPEGNSHGTKGARIVKLVPNKELAFEWIT